MKQLIPLQYLNEACFLSLNVDEKKYSMVLKISQDLLRDLLGVTFYDQLETQYPNFTSATDNATLYENYIKDYLAWQTYFNYLKFANFESTPTGLREHTDDNSSLIADVKMYAAEKNVKERVDFYKGRMINYMKLEKDKDSTKFPLWEERCDYGFSFGIGAVDKKSDIMFKVNKTIITNE